MFQLEASGEVAGGCPAVFERIDAAASGKPHGESKVLQVCPEPYSSPSPTQSPPKFVLAVPSLRPEKGIGAGLAECAPTDTRRRRRPFCKNFRSSPALGHLELELGFQGQIHLEMATEEQE